MGETANPGMDPLRVSLATRLTARLRDAARFKVLADVAPGRST